MFILVVRRPLRGWYDGYYQLKVFYMDITLFLAQAFGIYLVIGGVAMLAYPQAMDKLATMLSSDRASIMMGGFVALVVGVPLVLIHSLWNTTLEIIVSVLAWLTFLKGAVRLLLPDMVASWTKAFMKNQNAIRIILVVMVVVGAYLCWVGFGFSM